MNTAITSSEIGRAWRLLAIGLCAMGLFGVAWADSLESLTAYVIITLTAVLPSALWIRAGMPGIPLLPMAAAFHYLYFAVPILRQNVGQYVYTPEETMRAALTVAAFLLAATLGSHLLLGAASRRAGRASIAVVSRLYTVRLVFGGIAVGVAFHLGMTLSLFNGFGPYFGVVRSVATTMAAVSCYLAGHFRARRMLNGETWIVVLSGIVLLILLSWSSLLLVGGMVYALAAVLGYVITTKRVPWRMLAPLLVAVFVLHAGKYEMRNKYWITGFSQTTPIEQVPALMGEWVGDGIDAIATGNINSDIIDRASLLYMILYVERMTPDDIPYLYGETYALLPSYLVPRFLNEGKIASQAGLSLLNLRYGIQTDEARATTIGWGIVAEAFANFGYAGVLGIGLLFGVMAMLFTLWSAGAPPLSLPALLSIAALVTMINVEADLAYLLVNLWQALISTIIFVLPLHWLSGPRLRPPAVAPRLSQS